jgi:hypothetical protein
MHIYSPFFQTLHDERRPTGSLGRGTHYSVLRAVVFHDENGRPLPEGRFCDFAVIWDEDHDERAIEVLEKIYFSGLLSSFLIFGERKAFFTGIVPSGVLTPARIELLKSRIAVTCESVGVDYWTSMIEGIDGHSIINDQSERVGIYLRNVNMLWKLGLKDARDKRGHDGPYEGNPTRDYA